MPPADPATGSQLRSRLDRSSPLVWRRLRVRDPTTIAELHASIPLAFGWSDDPRHQFLSYGKAYGSADRGGASCADDPHPVRLADVRFRVGARFFYEYNVYGPWRPEIRLEQILPATPGQRYPVCIGGARAAPPEGCAGPNAVLALRQEHRSLAVIEHLLALIDNPADDLAPTRSCAGSGTGLASIAVTAAASTGGCELSSGRSLARSG